MQPSASAIEMVSTEAPTLGAPPAAASASADEDRAALTRDVTYRLASPDEAPELADVFLESVADMYARKGLTAEIPLRPAVIGGYEFVLATGSFHIAEIEGRIVAIAGAVIRDGLWYLSSFWARPEFRGRGGAMTLLRRLQAEALEQGAHTFFTWSSPDLPAIAAYLKLGMRPWDLILQFQGTPRRLPTVAASYETRSLDPEIAMELDRVVRGTPRAVDHAFLRGPFGADGRQVVRGETVVGYYYVNRGWIGPAAWVEASESAMAVIGLACREAMEANGSFRISLPGSNSVGIDAALAAGLPLVGTAQLMTSVTFGDITRYVPWGPGLF